MLRLAGLTKAYAGTKALKDISLSVPHGQMIAVIGRSGAGKSTLLRLLNRLIEPSSGSIRFDDSEVTALRGADLRRWRSQAAMIFQNYNLAPRLDVLTNVMVGASMEVPQWRRLCRLYTREERLRAARILDDLGLLDKALERAERLSGGQQQRVAIARALMQSPRLVLADEPVASLDPHNSQVVMETLNWINRQHGITVICNLHDLDLARKYADRVIGLRDGIKVFDGAVAALTPAVLNDIYGSAADMDGSYAAERSTGIAIPTLAMPG
ncbi:phosphonate ABC transporter ATP-binding protein [Oceanibaculum nanhaiense]|uniref:phosphonate ABC transporter ATP-binding protein n=1 Tax=Oceanibaculum nanhaiense TaxID=1909734 RepID=UPI00396E8EBE